MKRVRPGFCGAREFNEYGRMHVLRLVSPNESHVALRSMCEGGDGVGTARRKGGRTVNSDIAHGIRPIPLVLRHAIILPQQAGEVAQDGVALRQDLPVQLDDGDAARGVELLDGGVFGLGVFFEGVAHVFVGDAGVLHTGHQRVGRILLAGREGIDGGRG